MVLVVNEALARRYFPGEDPVGVELDRGVIVGVVADVRQAGLDQPAEPEIYQPSPRTWPPPRISACRSSCALSDRPSGGERRPRRDRRGRPLDRRLQRADDGADRDRLVMGAGLYRVLIGGFAALALGLAAIGLHGVIACHVTARCTSSRCAWRLARSRRRCLAW